jgi:hypothetical protein
MVNMRGELDRAMANARMPAADHALFGQMLRRCDNTTGEVPNRPVDKATGEIPPPRKYAPLLTTLFRQCELPESTGYRSFSHLAKHGWYERRLDGSDRADRRKFIGVLKVGEDCDCRGKPSERVCEQCGKSLRVTARSDAQFCSGKCRTAACRESQKPGHPVSVSVTSRGLFRPSGRSAGRRLLR